MIRILLQILFATIGLAVAFGALSLWVNTGRAPRNVTAKYDQLFRLIGANDPVTRCLIRMPEPVDPMIHPVTMVEPRACYTFSEPRIFRGIYFDEFEGQIFIEGAEPAERYADPKRVLWLDFDGKSDRSGYPIGLGRDEITRVWFVSFLGKETTSKGHFGHLGMSEAEIVVDKVLSARMVQQGKGYISQRLIQTSSDNPH